MVKEEGGANDLIARVLADPAFGLVQADIDGLLVPEHFIGRAPQQVSEYLEGTVRPLLKQNEQLLGERYELSV
ncbi:hypothetical protein SDC9_137199 [bioreactor metagenome]|uniref:Uncharacterized protein n=1 Tax=bioreactor metagenome TaxID=1076179 RepID=A0A645DMR4_9ZZZZ